MQDDHRGQEPEHSQVNPAARRDRPGEPHGTLDRRNDDGDPRPKGYQEAELDPRDQSGIAE